jgi:Rho GDP-dissociation inhibitor
MAELEHTHGDEDAAGETPGYQPPAPKTVEEILKSDADDESLRKYKESLLGTSNPVGLEVFPNDPRRVIVTKLGLVVDGRTDVELDLTGDLEKMKNSSFVIQEGCHYQLKIYFYVQREIVTGLKYVQESYRVGVRVDKSNFMVGSYGPKSELQSFTTPKEEAPTGMIARGTYHIKSLFTDDDKNEHLKWEWKLEIKKDWE